MGEEESEEDKKARREILLSLFERMQLWDKEIDSLILAAYRSMPEDFRSMLPFSEYYRYYRDQIGMEFSEAEDDQSEPGEEDAAEEPEDSVPLLPARTIPEDERCKRCGKEPHSFIDADYCNKCARILTDEAVKLKESFESQLLADPVFLNLTSEAKAISYVKDKYGAEEKKNKFMHLRAFAKDTYHLKEIKGQRKEE